MREAPIIYNSCQTVVVEIKDIAIEGVVEVDLGDRVGQQGRAHIRVNHLQKCCVKCDKSSNMGIACSVIYLQI